MAEDLASPSTPPNVSEVGDMDMAPTGTSLRPQSFATSAFAESGDESSGSNGNSVRRASQNRGNRELATELAQPYAETSSMRMVSTHGGLVAALNAFNRSFVMNSDSSDMEGMETSTVEGMGELLGEFPDESDDESDRHFAPKDPPAHADADGPLTPERTQDPQASSKADANSPPIAPKDPPPGCYYDPEADNSVGKSSASLAVQRAVAVLATSAGEHTHSGRFMRAARMEQSRRSGSSRYLREGAADPSQPIRRRSALQSMPSSSSLTSTVSSHSIQPKLLALPVDSLHCIGSFLTPKDWSSFGLANRGAGRACRDVFRRVRMHGFRCATEVVASWTRGEHADARELSALYIRSGVPIYPLSLGHSYHTLIWRMGIESKEMERPDEETADGNAAETTEGPQKDAPNPKVKLDRFYNERYDARSHDGYFVPSLTYLEEKCLFWRNRTPETDDDVANMSAARRHSLSNAISLRPPRLPTLAGPFNNQQGPFPDAANLFPPNMPALGTGAPLPLQLGQPAADADDAAAPAAPVVGEVPLPQPRRAMSVSDLASGQQIARLSGPDSNYVPRHHRAPPMTVRVHRHLADAHILANPAVNDKAGSMRAAPISLSADFFHPMASLVHSTAVSEKSGPSSNLTWGTTAGGLPPSCLQPTTPLPFDPTPFDPTANPEPVVHPADADDDLFSPIATTVADAASVTSAAAAAAAASAGTTSVPEMDAAAGMETPTSSTLPAVISRSGPAFTPSRHSISFGTSSTPSGTSHNSVETSAERISVVADVVLEIYTSSSPVQNDATEPADRKKSGSPSSADAAATATSDKMEAILARFAYYQRKLDSLLAHFDSFGFDECLLDFWDEFFPLTSGVHFYDKYTLVPRTSCLHRFLTKPCPKAVGIVQCEIERIKISSKKKGVGVKGRFFPSYEYRLFIRDRRNDDSEQPSAVSSSSKLPPRRDTVLMSAKNRGKNHHGVSHSTTGSKRGVNNYYLYMPQRSDVETHFESVNTRRAVAPSSIGIGANRIVELGRVQSNFIGTEFQIFSPCLIKRRAAANTATANARSMDRSVNSYAGSDSGDEEDIEAAILRSVNASGMGVPLSTSPEPRRKSRGNSFSRRLSGGGRSLSRGRRGNNEERTASPVPIGRKSRRGSWPNLYGGRPSRTSRRVVANSAADSVYAVGSSPSVTEPVMGEEESGAITYTANLLGNRPRIMDVCIPKVSENGAVSGEWRRHVESTGADGNDPETMMNRFKLLQQQGIHTNGGGADNPADGDGNGGSSPGDYGLMALQNRPPWWNVDLGAFVLNFGGRVSVASVKNFQLCDRNDLEHVMLQFGRIQGRHSFTMDFQYPLSAVQAFAIAISSLQSKISFG